VLTARVRCVAGVNVFFSRGVDAMCAMRHYEGPFTPSASTYVYVRSYFDSNFDNKIRPKKRISYAITMIFTKLPSLPNRVINITIRRTDVDALGVNGP